MCCRQVGIKYVCAILRLPQSDGSHMRQYDHEIFDLVSELEIAEGLLYYACGNTT